GGAALRVRVLPRMRTRGAYRHGRGAWRAPPMTRHTSLFLAANPSETGPLALDREAREIQVELERSRWRDRFELVTRWAAQPLDLLRELRRLAPTVVQFSGHGGPPEPDPAHAGPGAAPRGGGDRRPPGAARPGPVVHGH